MKKYNLILSDNPWEYDNKQQNDPARGGLTYPYLSMEELYNLPVEKICADDAILVNWVTFPKLVDSFYKDAKSANPLTIMKAWGFRPVTCLFVWIKTNRKGTAVYEDTDLDFYDDFYSGLGRYTNSNAEIAIVGRRGKGLERIAKNVKQLIFAPIREHSAKPAEQYQRLDKLYGNVPRIELFARRQNLPPEGWDFTGLDSTNEDIRDFLKGWD
jgi:N6-adenosine-specific RNA methylase IME4